MKKDIELKLNCSHTKPRCLTVLIPLQKIHPKSKTIKKNHMIGSKGVVMWSKVLGTTLGLSFRSWFRYIWNRTVQSPVAQKLPVHCLTWPSAPHLWIHPGEEVGEMWCDQRCKNVRTCDQCSCKKILSRVKSLQNFMLFFAHFGTLCYVSGEKKSVSVWSFSLWPWPPPLFFGLPQEFF